VVLATSPPLTAGIAGLAAGLLKRAPFVFEVRDLWPEVIEELGVVGQRLPLAVLDAMARLTYYGARRVVAVTPGIRRWLLEKRGLSADKVHLVTQGADLDLFPEPDRSAARAGLGLGDEFVVVYAGALGIANKIDVVLEAARRMSDRALFLIIGEGMEKKHLQALAAEWGLDRVKFLPGMARQDIVSHLTAADVGLVSLRSLPVFGTALPNKFFDYLGAGLPVVVNFPGDLARLLEEEGIGRYGGDNDPVRLAQTLEELQRDAAGRAEMGRRARLLAETTFRRDAQSQRLEEILMRAAGHPPAER